VQISWNIFSALFDNWKLVFRLAKRDILSRYRGSMLGVLWAAFAPLGQLSAYVFAFSVVFKVHWATGQSNSGGMALENVSYIKKVVFPLEVMVWVASFSTCFNALISFVILLAAMLLAGHPLHWTIFLLPFVVSPLFFFALGCGWLLSALGVFLRDLRHAVALISMMLMFMSPLFYSLHAVPEKYRFYVGLNPIAPAIDSARGVLFAGVMPDLLDTGVRLMVGVLFAMLSLHIFHKLKVAFSDVV
jgi:lipopolysaccharide transport system permease protein